MDELPPHYFQDWELHCEGMRVKYQCCYYDNCLERASSNSLCRKHADHWNYKFKTLKLLLPVYKKLIAERNEHYEEVF